jgi:two-component system C4-dicarboxylate transport sensor histidine kinase DctB
VLVTANRAAVYGTIARWLLHDLRSPVQALSLVAELLPEPGADTDSDLQATLRDSTRQLAAYVDLLDHATRTIPESAVPRPVVLSDVLTFLSRLYDSCRSPTRLDLSRAIGRPIPAVTGDEDALEHALLNLVMNAVEAIGDRDNGRIDVSAVAGPGAVELIVDDNGPGVPAEICDRLFEPHVTTKRRSARATGLGLTVARYLLECSGGTLTYAPKAAPGARFVARVPTWPAARQPL